MGTPMPSYILHRYHFSKDKVVTDGVTGSGQVTGPGGATYQLKNPIEDAPWKRRIKAFNHDHENFEEEIAAIIAKTLMPEDLDNPGQRIPDVSLVVIPGKKAAGIASKYIDGDRKTLNEYIDPNKKRPPKDPNEPNGRLVDIKLIAGPSAVPYQQNLNTPENAWLRKELSRMIAISALVGDHDVNPGNILVITEDKKKRLARIDFGHAFADQMRFPHFGGQRIHPNNIMDFFNRTTLDDVSRHGESKLWRSYPALVPSQELVDAMNEVSSADAEEKIHAAILTSQANFYELLKIEGQDQAHIINSLKYIAEHVGQCKISSIPKATLLDRLFRTMEDYVCNNVQQMKYVAEIMQLQVDIDKYLNQIPGAPNQYMLDYKYNLLKNSPYGPFSWVRTSDKMPVFQGDCFGYMKFRSAQIKSDADDLLNRQPKISSESEFVLIGDEPGASSGLNSPNTPPSIQSADDFVDVTIEANQEFKDRLKQKKSTAAEESDQLSTGIKSNKT